MIPLYEQLKRAEKGEVFYTTRPARNVTSAAARLGRKVRTTRCTVFDATNRASSLLRVGVLR